MLSAGSYILSVALLAVLVLSLGFSAVRLRQRLMPDWEGAPAHLVEAVVGVALLIWIAELLGVVGLLYAGTLVAVAVLVVAAVAVGPRVLSREKRWESPADGCRSSSPLASWRWSSPIGG